MLRKISCLVVLSFLAACSSGENVSQTSTILPSTQNARSVRVHTNKSRPFVNAGNFQWVQHDDTDVSKCPSGWYTVSGGESYTEQKGVGNDPNTGMPNSTYTQWNSTGDSGYTWTYASCVNSTAYNKDFEWVSGSGTSHPNHYGTAIATCDSGYVPVTAYTDMSGDEPDMTEWQPDYGNNTFIMKWFDPSYYYPETGHVYLSCVKSTTGVQIAEQSGTGSSEAGCGQFGSSYIIVGGSSSNTGSPYVNSEYPTTNDGRQRWNVFLDPTFQSSSVTAVAVCLPTTPS